ncbi:MAG: hypothetical protein ABFD97_25360 [Syntrophobacter sp.]
MSPAVLPNVGNPQVRQVVAPAAPGLPWLSSAGKGDLTRPSSKQYMIMAYGQIKNIFKLTLPRMFLSFQACLIP